MSVPASNRNYSTESVLIAVFSVAALLVHLLTNGRYGYFRDELYYIACGQHLAFGYVDQPPLSILLLRLSQLLLGDSLFAIRLLPALAGAAIVARELFASIEDLGQVVSSPWAMPFERRRHIYLCRDLKVSVRELWSRVKKWL